MADNMQSLALTGGEVAIEGAVYIEATAAGVQPWRLPLAEMRPFWAG